MLSVLLPSLPLSPCTSFTVVINETEGHDHGTEHQQLTTEEPDSLLENPAVACFVQDTLKRVMILGFKHLEGGAGG